MSRGFTWRTWGHTTLLTAIQDSLLASYGPSSSVSRYPIVSSPPPYQITVSHWTLLQLFNDLISSIGVNFSSMSGNSCWTFHFLYTLLNLWSLNIKPIIMSHHRLEIWTRPQLCSIYLLLIQSVLLEKNSVGETSPKSTYIKINYFIVLLQKLILQSLSNTSKGFITWLKNLPVLMPYIWTVLVQSSNTCLVRWSVIYGKPFSYFPSPKFRGWLILKADLLMSIYVYSWPYLGSSNDGFIELTHDNIQVAQIVACLAPRLLAESLNPLCLTV